VEICGNAARKVFSMSFSGSDIQFELDVVGVGGIDVFGRVPVGQHEFAGGARDFTAAARQVQ